MISRTIGALLMFFAGDMFAGYMRAHIYDLKGKGMLGLCTCLCAIIGLIFILR